MSFWSFLGEFFLFRWIFGKHRNNEPHVFIPPHADSPVSHKKPDNDSWDSFNPADYYRGEGYHGNCSPSNDDYHYGRSSCDDFIEQEDDYDMIDDFLD